eukprot:10055262-Alexandrium_andersonii.AAC.1
MCLKERPRGPSTKPLKRSGSHVWSRTWSERIKRSFGTAGSNGQWGFASSSGPGACKSRWALAAASGPGACARTRARTPASGP